MVAAARVAVPASPLVRPVCLVVLFKVSHTPPVRPQASDLGAPRRREKRVAHSLDFLLSCYVLGTLEFDLCKLKMGHGPKDIEKTIDMNWMGMVKGATLSLTLHNKGGWGEFDG